MTSIIKSGFILLLTLLLLIGLSSIITDAYSQGSRLLCCNENFPYYAYGANSSVSLRCVGEEEITAETCARYWSAYGYGEHVTELCDALPDPPLPSIPVPSSFDVSNNNNQPEITWDDYYVHWYDIYRKTDDGSWSHVQRITTYSTDSWTDESADISNHCYCYKMRGSVYDAYSNYTSVKSIGVFTASMSGPSSLDSLENGTFTANPSACGVSPFDYTWYKMQLGYDKKSGGESKGPPIGQWVHLPQYDGSQTAVGSGVPPGFKMRVIIEDDEHETVTVDKTVTVTGNGLKKSIPENARDGEIVNNQTSHSFKLLPNYPNPFNPETIICYQISQDSHVSLTIYNLLGEEVRRLVNKKQPSGKYNIRWNGCDSYGKKLVGGIYIYKIIAVTTSGDAPSRFVQTRKMVMMK